MDLGVIMLIIVMVIILALCGLLVLAHIWGKKENAIKHAELMKKQQEEDFFKHQMHLNENNYEAYSFKFNEFVNELKSLGGYCKIGSFEYGIKDNRLYSFCKLSLAQFTEMMNRGPFTFNDTLANSYIDLNKMKYYSMQGSKRQEQHISGGGGGGSSLGGAVAGYVIAGGVGAVIGSRKKAESIQTEYVNVDDRKLVLTMTDNTTKSYPYQYYEYMLKMVPEKDYDVYIANLKSKGLNN